MKGIEDILVSGGRAAWVGMAAAGLLAGSGCGSVPVRTNAGEESATQQRRHDTQAADAGIEVAKKFWSAVAAGDTAGMAALYADEVVVFGGSELLKAEWGLPGGGDRSRALNVRKADLLAGYESLLEVVGRERWRDILTGSDNTKLSFITVVVADWADIFERLAEEPLSEKSRNAFKVGGTLADLHIGDLFLRVEVRVGEGSDILVFQLRQTTGGKWQVVGEATDY